MVPFEKELINFKLLTKKERDYLISYNLEIYKNVEKYLTYEEKILVIVSILKFF